MTLPLLALLGQEQFLVIVSTSVNMYIRYSTELAKLILGRNRRLDECILSFLLMWTILAGRRCNRVSDWSRAIFKPSKILTTKQGICFTENGVGDNPISNFKPSFLSKIGKKRSILDWLVSLMHAGYAFVR